MTFEVELKRSTKFRLDGPVGLDKHAYSEYKFSSCGLCGLVHRTWNKKAVT